MKNFFKNKITLAKPKSKYLINLLFFGQQDLQLWHTTTSSIPPTLQRRIFFLQHSSFTCQNLPKSVSRQQHLSLARPEAGATRHAGTCDREGGAARGRKPDLRCSCGSVDGSLGGGAARSPAVAGRLANEAQVDRRRRPGLRFTWLATATSSRGGGARACWTSYPVASGHFPAVDRACAGMHLVSS